MSLLSTLWKLASGAVKAEGGPAAVVRKVKRLAQRWNADRTDPSPMPLSHKDAERIAEAGRRAGHENDPPTSRSRYE